MKGIRLITQITSLVDKIRKQLLKGIELCNKDIEKRKVKINDLELENKELVSAMEEAKIILNNINKIMSK